MWGNPLWSIHVFGACPVPLGNTSLCNTAYFAGPLFLTLGFTYETDEEEFGSADNKEVFDCLKLLK